MVKPIKSQVEVRSSEEEMPSEEGRMKKNCRVKKWKKAYSQHSISQSHGGGDGEGMGDGELIGEGEEVGEDVVGEEGVVAEDEEGTGDELYQAWRRQRISTTLPAHDLTLQRSTTSVRTTYPKRTEAEETRCSSARWRIKESNESSRRRSNVTTAISHLPSLLSLPSS
jgi:hypothetical protein